MPDPAHTQCRAPRAMDPVASATTLSSLLREDAGAAETAVHRHDLARHVARARAVKQEFDDIGDLVGSGVAAHWNVADPLRSVALAVQGLCHWRVNRARRHR